MFIESAIFGMTSKTHGLKKLTRSFLKGHTVEINNSQRECQEWYLEADIHLFEYSLSHFIDLTYGNNS